MLIKNPIFVLEGPDASGKTTLAQALGCPIIHCTYRWTDRMPLYHWAALNQAVYRAKSGPVILDRWWPSQVVYATVYRDGNPWPTYPRLLDRLALRYGVTYIFCLPSDPRALAARFQARDQVGGELYSGNQAKVWSEYIKIYNRLMNGQRQDIYVYDLDNHGHDLPGFWKDQLTRWSRSVPSSYGQEDRVVGNLTGGDILFIGDQPSTRPYTRSLHSWPFFSLVGCSGYFLEELERLNFDESRAAWININYQNGIDLTRRLLPTRWPIILGKRALDTFTANFPKVPYSAIAHPQFARRFHRHDDYFERQLKFALSKREGRYGDGDTGLA